MATRPAGTAGGVVSTGVTGTADDRSDSFPVVSTEDTANHTVAPFARPSTWRLVAVGEATSVQGPEAEADRCTR